MFDGFGARRTALASGSLFVRMGGDGPPLLLLHGFPETHLMWRGVAPLLAHRFTVICADLPGYGASDCPADGENHVPHSKRAMAATLAELMRALGFDRFAVAGHDRGGRVAYRLALDHADRVSRVAVLDIVPTAAAWDRADARFALAYWPWSLLAQPTPLPERLLAAAPDAILDSALRGWGSRSDAFPPEVRRAYVAALADPLRAHSICEEYRAAAGLDREHDHADIAAGRRIACPALALWAANGPVDTWYAETGGPLGLWRLLASNVAGRAVPGGHFFPEEHPAETAAALADFLT